MTKALHDARRTQLALMQLADAHAGVMWALALGLPLPDTSEEMAHARMAVDYQRGVVAQLADA